MNGSRALALVLLLAGLACSSGTVDNGIPGRCPPDGTPSNEKGFGASCTPGGHECDHIYDGGVRLCPPDLDPSLTASSWFCTFFCSTDADCGSNQVCVHDPAGNGCMPTRCLPFNCPGGVVDGGCVGPDAG